MTRREKIARALLRPINPSVIIILGIYTVVWGLWIVNPFWSVFSHAPLYAAMAAFASEYFWGWTAIISGLFIIRGALKPSYYNIQLGAFIGFFHWIVITVFYFAADWQSTGGITSLTFAVYSAIVWLNIKVNRANYE